MNRSSVEALRLTWLAARISSRFSRRLAGFFTWRLWFTPWRVELSEKARAREAAWLADTTPLRVPFAGGDLRGFTAGEGPAVLLVHGWGDRASRLGAFVAPLTAAGFRVVAVDVPAHGDSPGLRTNAYEGADALRATAEHVGGVDAVIAHSMGGLETMLAMRDGLRVERAVFLASAVRLDHAMDRFEAMFALPPRAMQGLAAAIQRRFGSRVWDDLAADRLATGFSVPALLIHDADDQQVALDDGRALASAWPGMRLVTTHGLGHDRLLRDPDVVRQAVEFVGQSMKERQAPPRGVTASRH